MDAPPGMQVLMFVGATVVIGFGGTRLAALADRLADRTGIGEALAGGLFLGIATSLPGITASVTAAIEGRPELAVTNAVGGIAIQTAFLAIADLFHRRANLEHAAASLANVVQAALLILLLTLLIVAIHGPDRTVAGVHLATPVLFAAYALGLGLARSATRRPMWQPRSTPSTVPDVPDDAARREHAGLLWGRFVLSAVAVLAAGAVVAHSAGRIASATGISESVMGGVFTAAATSLPELVTTIAAVRRGALTLAVSDIVGGNAFDVLFVCVADVAYRQGSIFHAAGRRATFLIGIAVVLNTVLLMGLLHRERRGFANIGFESVLILVVYAAGIAILAVGGF